MNPALLPVGLQISAPMLAILLALALLIGFIWGWVAHDDNE